MSLIYKVLSRTPNYVRRFGIFHGIKLLFQIEAKINLPQKSNIVNRYYLPESKSPVYLRKCIGDHATFWQCLVQNQYDFSKFPQAKKLQEEYDQKSDISQGTLIIDCGGNIGLSAIWFAKKFRKSKIYVIEPDIENIEILNMNIQAFSDQIIPIKGGIWSDSSYAKISNPKSGPASFQLESTLTSDFTNVIQCFTIDQICELANNRFPLIVKLDIEGSQDNLFSKNTEWVNRTNLITLELDDWLLPWQGTSRNFFKCLSQYDFDYLLGGESIFCFRDIRI